MSQCSDRQSRQKPLLLLELTLTSISLLGRADWAQRSLGIMLCFRPKKTNLLSSVYKSTFWRLLKNASLRLGLKLSCWRACLACVEPCVPSQHHIHQVGWYTWWCPPSIPALRRRSSAFRVQGYLQLRSKLKASRCLRPCFKKK